MKRILLFVVAILFTMVTTAQPRATLLEQHFNGAAFPAGWTKVGQGTSNWYIQNSDEAGGKPRELLLYWNPQFNGTARVVTPAIDLTGVNSVVVSFKHALDWFAGNHTLGIATSSDNGTTWNTGWTTKYNNSGIWEVNEVIVTPDMGQSSVKFCIFYTGNSYNINLWYFDDIEIYVQEESDLAMKSINTPSSHAAGEVEMSFNVFNRGGSDITSVEASYEIEGKAPVTETFDVTIPSLTSSTLTFTTKPFLLAGEYEVNYSINKVNGEVDDNPDNNTDSKDIEIVSLAAPRIPMIEHFSSSTCGPCVSVNVQTLNFCNANPGRFTYTKYQMSWPSPGDPYYTAEGGVRRTYYGVNSVPTYFIDGQSIGINKFERMVENVGLMDVGGSFFVEGNTIHVKVDVTPYIDIQARIYVSVNEKKTTGNVGGNGETSFHHIMMKMLPNAQGTTQNFQFGETQHLEFTQDLSSTNVEEMSDLEVSIWVQNYSTKETYNSHFAYEYTNEHPYPARNLVLSQVEGENYTLNATWDAPEQGSPISYDVYLNNEFLANTTSTNYTFTTSHNFAAVAVVARYGNDKTSVRAIAEPFYVEEELEDQGLVSETTSVVLDAEHESAELHLTNANNLTMAPIVINNIAEVNEEGRQYLTITNQDLPLTLNYGETFAFMVEPNMTGEEKGVAQTSIVVSSDAGDVVFMVSVDGDLLSVIELTDETQLFPNPTNGNFTVQGANMAKVEVYNLVGQKVYEAQGNVVHVDAANWNKGLYLVNIINQEGSYETKKVLVK